MNISEIAHSFNHRLDVSMPDGGELIKATFTRIRFCMKTVR